MLFRAKETGRSQPLWWGMCALDSQGGGQVLIKEDQHEQHLWGDLDSDEDEQRLSGEVEIGEEIWKKINERRGKADEVLKEVQGS